jgi:hypothetical protein
MYPDTNLDDPKSSVPAEQVNVPANPPVETEPYTYSPPFRGQQRMIRARDIVRLVKAFGSDTATVHAGFVLSVHPVTRENKGENGEPVLTVAFLDPKAPVQVIGSSNWHQAFQRISGVPHYSNIEARAGKHGIFWVDFVDGDELAENLPKDLPVIQNGESAVFSRQHVEDFYGQPPKVVPAKVAGIPGRPVPIGDQGSVGRILAGSPTNPGTGPLGVGGTAYPPYGSPAMPGTPETKQYSDGTVVTGTAPLPDLSPAQQDAVAGYPAATYGDVAPGSEGEQVIGVPAVPGAHLDATGELVADAPVVAGPFA